MPLTSVEKGTGEGPQATSARACYPLRKRLAAGITGLAVLVTAVVLAVVFIPWQHLHVPNLPPQPETQPAGDVAEINHGRPATQATALPLSGELTVRVWAQTTARSSA